MHDDESLDVTAKEPKTAAEIHRLAGELLRHRSLYEMGIPEISDAAYDHIEDQLRSIAPSHPALLAVGQTEALVGKKVAHDEPMLSLNKTYDIKDLLSWAEGQELVGTWKVDGVSLSLIYQQGKLVLAKTRGNGREGEDVTIKALWVPDIPHRVSHSSELEVRGELYCHEEHFGKLSEEMVALGLERPTNPRNIVAGLLGRKTQHELMRHFNFLAFDAKTTPNNHLFSREDEKLRWLGTQAFAVPEPKLLTDEEGIKNYLSELKTHMATSTIGLDGAVFTLNDLKSHKIAGATAHHPRYKMSFKWQGQTAQSVIRRIEWSTSRLGIVTPVAVIDPVFLSGAQITNVTLHNAGHIRAYNLKVGDCIEIVRSGEVIPKFLHVVTPAPGDYQWLESCPSCGAALEFDEVRLKCPNSSMCQAQQMRSILNWIRAVEIDDLSEKRLENLMDLGLVTATSDLYRLSQDDLMKLPLTKKKMADKLFHNIQASRQPPLPRFLLGLGIESGGVTTWESLLDHFPTLEALQTATPEAIAAINGFAARSAQQIVDGLADKRQETLSLLQAGVTPLPWSVRAVSGGLLSGKTVAITGALSRPRAEIESLIKDAGGKASSAVTSKTFVLVTNETESQSTKMKKALALNVPIWDENRLITFLEAKNP